MIISHTHKFIFVKSYKTAGTSVEAALSQFCGGDDVVTALGDYKFNRDRDGNWVHQSLNPGMYHQHDSAKTIKNSLPSDVWNSYYRFSIARNPWDRAVSFFAWEQRRASALKPRKRFYHYLGIPFDAMADVRKRFGEYIRDDWTNNDPFYTIDDQLCVDFIIRYECLTEDYQTVCESIGLPTNELPQLKGGIRKKERHYSEYYDDASRAVVAERNANDINLFGYRFEQA